MKVATQFVFNGSSSRRSDGIQQCAFLCRIWVSVQNDPQVRGNIGHFRPGDIGLFNVEKTLKSIERETDEHPHGNITCANTSHL